MQRPILHVLCSKAAGPYLNETARRLHWQGPAAVAAALPENEDAWRSDIVARNENDRRGFLAEIAPAIGGFEIGDGTSMSSSDAWIVVPGHENSTEVIELVAMGHAVGARAMTIRDLVLASAT